MRAPFDHDTTINTVISDGEHDFQIRNVAAPGCFSWSDGGRTRNQSLSCHLPLRRAANLLNTLKRKPQMSVYPGTRRFHPHPEPHQVPGSQIVRRGRPLRCWREYPETNTSSAGSTQPTQHTHARRARVSRLYV